MALPITDSSTEFVTLAEVKRHLNIDDTDLSNDDEIDLVRGAAQEHVENLIGPVLHRTVTQTLDPTRRGHCGGWHSRGRCRGGSVLSTLPVLSVTSVTVNGSPVTGYVFSPATATLCGAYSWAQTVVTYSVGRASCPDAVRLATLVIAAHMWRTQLGNSPSALPDEETQGFDPSAADDVPPRAKALLRPYLKPAGVA